MCVLICSWGLLFGCTRISFKKSSLSFTDSLVCMVSQKEEDGKKCWCFPTFSPQRKSIFAAARRCNFSSNIKEIQNSSEIFFFGKTFEIDWSAKTKPCHANHLRIYNICPLKTMQWTPTMVTDATRATKATRAKGQHYKIWHSYYRVFFHSKF